MKKSIFIFIAMVLSMQITAFAQKSTVGITGGATVYNMRGTVNGKDQKGDSKVGYTYGLLVNVPLADNITFQPGLHYVQKGKLESQNVNGIKQEVTTALRYAEMQFNVLFSTQSGSENLFAGIGPTASITFPSKFVTDINGTKTETDVHFGNLSASNFRAFDFGGNVLAGIRFAGGFFVSFNYTLGFRNLYPGGSSTNDIKTACFGIKAGIMIKN